MTKFLSFVSSFRGRERWTHLQLFNSAKYAKRFVCIIPNYLKQSDVKRESGKKRA